MHSVRARVRPVASGPQREVSPAHPARGRTDVSACTAAAGPARAVWPPPFAQMRAPKSRSQRDRSGRFAGASAASRETPAPRGMKIMLGRLLSILTLRSGDRDRGFLGERSRAGRFGRCASSAGFLFGRLCDNLPGCAASTYRSLSFARWFSPSIDASPTSSQSQTSPDCRRRVKTGPPAPGEKWAT
jgi:hypothetical protein